MGRAPLVTPLIYTSLAPRLLLQEGWEARPTLSALRRLGESLTQMMVPLSSPITITGWRGLKATWVSLVRFFCITERGGEGWGRRGGEGWGRRGGGVEEERRRKVNRWEKVLAWV